MTSDLPPFVKRRRPAAERRGTGPVTSRATRVLLIIAATLTAGCLAAGCSSNGRVKEAISSFTAGSSVKPAKPQATGPTGVPSATAAPSAQPSVRRAPAGADSTSGNGGSTPVLLWVAVGIGVVLVIVLAVWLIHRSRRRAAAAARWRAQAAHAYAEGKALHDMIGVAEIPGALAAAEAGARWVNVQYRADDLARKLFALREDTADDEAKAVVSNVLGALQAVCSAMTAERVSDGSIGSDAAAVQGCLSFFGTALRELHQVTRGE
jgi:hypothetical protein